ncbi:hypothetical protein [Thermoflavimicrobium daqui]|uniref:Uncharacterized protein n=1 Tax=Thermoflavimicrobium daqui TaxID=2137476 RepID=A0A364K793_9BACL|nr:hypothetical protein [Thermoflavimicrobium daqui]RAL26167.1 hypothetical protein DL897_03990 [Thermoflavimicrobium daqui]
MRRISILLLFLVAFIMGIFIPSHSYAYIGSPPSTGGFFTEKNHPLPPEVKIKKAIVRYTFSEKKSIGEIQPTVTIRYLLVNQSKQAQNLDLTYLLYELTPEANKTAKKAHHELQNDVKLKLSLNEKPIDYQYLRYMNRGEWLVPKVKEEWLVEPIYHQPLAKLTSQSFDNTVGVKTKITLAAQQQAELTISYRDRGEFISQKVAQSIQSHLFLFPPNAFWDKPDLRLELVFKQPYFVHSNLPFTKQTPNHYGIQTQKIPSLWLFTIADGTSLPLATQLFQTNMVKEIMIYLFVMIIFLSFLFFALANLMRKKWLYLLPYLIPMIIAFILLPYPYLSPGGILFICLSLLLVAILHFIIYLLFRFIHKLRHKTS